MNPFIEKKKSKRSPRKLRRKNAGSKNRVGVTRCCVVNFFLGNQVEIGEKEKEQELGWPALEGRTQGARSG